MRLSKLVVLTLTLSAYIGPVWSLFTIECLEEMIEKNGKTCILLSSPRSANTWVRYCVQYLTEYDANLVKDSNERERIQDPPLQMDPSNKKHLLAKSHRISYPYAALKPHIDNNDLKLILLVRNYQELIGSYASDWGIRFKLPVYNKLRNLINDCSWHYFDNLEIYDQWEENSKLLVYYEDLMQEPRKEIEKIIRFLVEDDDLDLKLDDFFTHYNQHKKLSLKTYNNFSRSASNGEDIFFYKKLVPEKYSNEIEDIIKERYPYLLETYLSRYLLDHISFSATR